MDRIALGCVKKRIRELSDEGRSKNALIAASSGADRHAARQAKSGIGATARVLLLAYAMMRGVPYEKLERRTRTTPWGVVRILDDVSEVIGEHAPGIGIAEVGAWFRGEVEP